MFDKTSRLCLGTLPTSIKPLSGCNIVVLRRLSVGFFHQVILKALLFPNSNIQEHFVTITGRVHTAGPMRKRSLILMKIEYKSC